MGVLLMIPLRRALIVKEHGRLTYPEGTACAEVLVAGEKGGLQARRLFQAFGLAFTYKFLMSGLKAWKEYPGWTAKTYTGASISAEVSPELMGVGYIIGPRIAGYLFAGGTLPTCPIPAIKLFGSGLTEPIFAETKLIADMSPGEVGPTSSLHWGRGVATAGIVALVRSLPTIVAAFRSRYSSSLGDVGSRLRTNMVLRSASSGPWRWRSSARAPQLAVNLLDSDPRLRSSSSWWSRPASPARSSAQIDPRTSSRP